MNNIMQVARPSHPNTDRRMPETRPFGLRLIGTSSAGEWALWAVAALLV